MTRARLLLASSLLVLPLLASCSGGSGDEGEAGGASSSPVATPTTSPFSFTITGPETAEVGEQLTATLTNTGRLPNRYRLEPDPVGAVTFEEPEVSVSPGESAEITMTAVQLPAIVRVQSVTSGGSAEGPYLSIGVAE